MATKASVNTGNFTVSVVGDLKPDVHEKIVSNGVIYDLQRGGLSKGYVEVAGVPTEDGKSKRLPGGFERSSVEYNDENAEALREAIAEWAGGVFAGTPTISITKYEGSEAASPMKRATAFVDALLDDGDKEAQMRQMFATLGLTSAADADRDALIAFANSKGLGIQPPRAKKNGE